jgi:hypothetical protein
MGLRGSINVVVFALNGHPLVLYSKFSMIIHFVSSTHFLLKKDAIRRDETPIL